MLGQDDNPGNIEKEARRSMNADGEEGDAEDSDAATESIYTETGLIDRSKIDPRSYLAKSVLQRMLIISAGVVFNLIFAVIFAAIAFKSGVDYEPSLVGTVVGSGPAWEHNLTGADIKRIGETTTDAYFTFSDLAQEIALTGEQEEPIELEYIPYGEEQSQIIQVKPEPGFRREMMDIRLLGFGFRLKPKIGKEGAIEGSAASQADPKFKADDLITEVNGIPIKTDIDLRHALIQNSDKVAEFTLKRQTGNKNDPTTEIVKTKVDRNPIREVGFATEWLPSLTFKRTLLQKQLVYRLTTKFISINGQPRGDLMTLDLRMIKIVNQNSGDPSGETGSGVAEHENQRAGKILNVSIQPNIPLAISSIGPDKPIGIDSLGIGHSNDTEN